MVKYQLFLVKKDDISLRIFYKKYLILLTEKIFDFVKNNNPVDGPNKFDVGVIENCFTLGMYEVKLATAR